MNRIASPALPQEMVDRRRVRFTPETFWSLHERGVLPKTCELVDGELWETPARYFPETATTGEICRSLSNAWHDRHLVGSHATHVFASGWLPMPDVIVYDALPPRRPGKGIGYPSPRLVVEVVDETLDYDLGEKPRRYAAEGVEELWVADVKARQLHVFRDPVGDAWRVRLLYLVGDAVSPLCMPDAKLAVADLLPDLYPPG